MKPEEQRIAIAEWCRVPLRGKPIRETRFGPSHLNGKKIVDRIVGYEKAKLPDYLNDLNAIHEAEAELNERQLNEMVKWLYAVPGRFWRATAAQRAEALLRTIGKWTDSTLHTKG